MQNGHFHTTLHTFMSTVERVVLTRRPNCFKRGATCSPLCTACNASNAICASAVGAVMPSALEKDSEGMASSESAEPKFLREFIRFSIFGLKRASRLLLWLRLRSDTVTMARPAEFDGDPRREALISSSILSLTSFNSSIASSNSSCCSVSPGKCSENSVQSARCSPPSPEYLLSFGIGNDSSLSFMSARVWLL